MRKLRMKKATTLSLMVLFAAAILLPMIPYGFAEHTATVVWLGAEVGGEEVGTVDGNRLNMPEISYPIWVYFIVANEPESTNDIIAVKVGIPWDADSEQAQFEFSEGSVDWDALNWVYEMQNLDPDGDPKEIWYTTGQGESISPDGTGLFGLKFKAGPPSCNYRFVVFTEDNAGDAYSHELFINIDKVPPEVSIDEPSEELVLATWDPYPVSHYMWVKVSAWDIHDSPDPDQDHWSGISRITISVDDEPWIDRDYEPPLSDQVIEEQLWNLAEGTHTIKAQAFDGAGNPSAIAEFTFEYKLRITDIQIIDPEDKKGTVGPTTMVNPDTGWVEGSIEPHGGKVLGTRVMLEGIEFTPNSEVDITVYIPTYSLDGGWLLVYQTTANSTGGFTGSFVFPTAPYGTYEIYAEDAEGRFDNDWFTVVPEVIYIPEIVMGPAFIEVKATGLTGNGYVRRFMVDGTDALVGTNLHTMIGPEPPWRTGSNGTLYTISADKPGFLMPVIEPGTYEINMSIYDGWWWDGKAYEGEGTEKPRDIEVGNKLRVVNDFEDLMDAIEENGGKLDDLDAKIVQIKGDIAVIITNLGEIEAKLEDLDAKIVQIKGDIAVINTKLGEIEVKLDDIIEEIELVKDDTEDIIGHAVQIKTIVGDIKGIVESIEDDVATIKTNVGDIETAIGEIEIPSDQIDRIDQNTSLQPATVALSLIAAISAIAAAVMVLRKVYVK